MVSDQDFFLQATESEVGDVDLTRLPEGPVDSEDEEEEDEEIDRTDPLQGRDLVRECLEKEPADKTDDDIGKKYICSQQEFHSSVYIQIPIGA